MSSRFERTIHLGASRLHTEIKNQMSFSDLGVPADLVTSLEARAITSPFPIQQMTIGDALAGRDICGKAPTGSGKTLAFSIPLVAGVERARPRSPRGLVLVPTRELAAQVQAVVEPLAKARGLRATSVYGGVGFEPQLKAIRRGVDIVVACPGRLNDLLERGALTLEDVSFVVVDEADRMADMGFLPSVRQLLDQTSRSRQTLLFSATLDGDVDLLIRKYQKSPVRHEVMTDDDAEDARLHLFWRAPRPERLSLCIETIKRFSSAVVFTRTKHGANRLQDQLTRNNISAVTIHGGRTQAQRDRALSMFSSGQVRVLVATDVAARGIHVDGLDCVIHYDAPEDDKTYVHRSGRTGRAGADGTVVTFVGPEQVRDVTQMQRRLQMAAGVVDPNFKALPEKVEFTPAPPPQARAPREQGHKRVSNLDQRKRRRTRNRRRRPAA